MKFRAEIDIMPLPALLDPQGKAVSNTMPQMGLGEIVGVRIGKHVTMEIEAASMFYDIQNELLGREIMGLQAFDHELWHPSF